MTGPLLAGPAGPLLPDPASAHDWVRRELLRPEYRPSLVQRFQGWLAHLLHHLEAGSTSLGDLGRPVLLLLLLLLIAGVTFLVLRLRRNPGRQRDETSVFGNARRSSAEHERLARSAFDEGAWDDAVVEGVRALTAGLVERGLVADLPAATAHEVTGLAAPRFPTHAQRLEQAAVLFDETRYGDRRATRERAGAVIALCRDIAAADPVSGAARRGRVGTVPR